MDILYKLEEFITEVSSLEKVCVNKNNIIKIIETKDDAGFLQKMIANNAIKKMKIDFPDRDNQYSSVASLELDWVAAAEVHTDEFLWGGFKILNIFESLGGPSHFWDIYNNDDRFWNNNAQPESEAIWQDFLPKLNYFHKSGHGDDGTFGCILREEGVYPCPIYFYDSGIWFEMEMGMEEYYNKMIECKAVYYWQYFYISPDVIVKKLGNFKPMYEEYSANYFNGPHPFMDKYKDGTFTFSIEGVLHQMEIIIKRFPTLFPGYDTAFFEEKYNALKRAFNNQ